MASKKTRQTVSYVIEPPNSLQGHKRGVNGLAVDSDNSILYSGGRDGIVCQWDLNLDLQNGSQKGSVRDTSSKRTSTATLRAQTHPHMHWVNDIVLVQNNTALVSGSSDLSVKVWRPHSEIHAEPETIGSHADYVKCVARSPDPASTWVASGGLDRRLYLWDLNGGGKTLEIDVSGEEKVEKGSVYALSVGRNMIVNGGPEATVRLWDTRTGQRITKFVGHTKTIRSILVNDAADMVMTSSSDQTIKLWSITAGRCMYTFTMHNESVWSLFSEDPSLGVFYSSDRSGLVVKTDVRGSLEDMDDGLSFAVAQENESVSKVVASGNNIWTATSKSSINRWASVDLNCDDLLPESFQHRRTSSTATARQAHAATTAASRSSKKEIPAKSILRISNTAQFPSLPASEPEPAVVAGGAASTRKAEILDPVILPVEPIYQLPEETIEGQSGLVKHKLLNDRRRVLTLDTAGDVVLWDLIRCKPIKKFGKRHLDEVEPEVNTLEAVAPWCSVDTSSGGLSVTLEPFNCFDAEMYVDELEGLEDKEDFRDDQRVNLGKWILRYLFANLIEEETRRDAEHRKQISAEAAKQSAIANRASPPPAISIPPHLNDPSSSNPATPGMSIGLATPAPHLGQGDGTNARLPTIQDRRASQFGRPSEDTVDFFAGGIAPADNTPKPAQGPTAPAADASKPTTDASKDKEKDNAAKTPSTPFGKKFRMGMSFGSKKLGRSASTAAEKPVVVDEKAEGSDSSSTHEKEVEDCFLGVIQKIRHEYERQLAETPDKEAESLLMPSPPIDTPVLELSPATKIILQEERSGGSGILYTGTVGSVGTDADIIEKRAPMWLGEVLLQNQIPIKEPVKVSFVLHPWKDSLPSIASVDGNNRLNANRMLRVKKILGYVAEKIDPQPDEPEPDALLPEEYLELYCNDQLLPHSMSLATLRAHVWKGGNDVVLYYKANGKKEIPFPPPQPMVPEPEPPATTAPAPALTPATAAA